MRVAAGRWGSVWAAVVAVLLTLTGCGDVPEPVVATSWEGQAAGRWFRPAFQRWRIVQVVPLEDAAVPAELAGVPIALYGRDVYLAPSFYTLPALSSPGDRLLPACFRAIEGTLIAEQPLPKKESSGATAPAPLELHRLEDGRLSMELDGLFRLVLERQALQEDGGYHERRLQVLYNHRLRGNEERYAQACGIGPAPVALRPAQDLAIEAVESGRRVIIAGSDLDPETPLLPRSASVPQRSSLPLGDPGAIVSGCAGVVRLLRVVTQPAPDTSSGEAHFLVGGIAGKTAEGEICDRVELVRRLDPAQLLALYELPAPSNRTPVLRLLGWSGPGRFTAQVGDAELELSGVDGPVIRTRLLRRPGITTADEIEVQTGPGEPPPAVPPKATPPASPPRRTASRPIERWVDENGVVHYSNMGRPPRNRSAR